MYVVELWLNFNFKDYEKHVFFDNDVADVSKTFLG